MAAGLLVYDLLLLAFAVGLWGGAGWVGARVHAALAPFGPWLAIPAALLAGLLAAILAVGALGLLTPRPDAGRVELMKGRRFWAWLIRSLYRRVLLPGPLKPIVFTFNTLRFLALRALGARVAFSANMSTDVELLDPPLLEVGPGATIGDTQMHVDVQGGRRRHRKRDRDGHGARAIGDQDARDGYIDGCRGRQRLEVLGTVGIWV